MPIAAWKYKSFEIFLWILLLFKYKTQHLRPDHRIKNRIFYTCVIVRTDNSLKVQGDPNKMSIWKEEEGKNGRKGQCWKLWK